MKAYSDKFLRNVKPDVIGDFIKEQILNLH